MKLQAYVKDNAALLLEKPDQFATIIMHIPQGCIVNVSYSHGDWYAIIFAGTHGFLQSSHLSFRDVQSCWADRYGPGATSLYRQNATPDQIEILQGDLIRFFHPVCINLDVNGTFDFKTQHIILHFQRVRGLLMSGAATPQTKAHLYSLLNE